jgi:ferritin
MFFDLLTDMNADVDILEIPACNFTFNNVLDIAKVYLEREIQTTEDIKFIKEVAVESGNAVVEEMARKMISLQQTEMEESTTWGDKAELTGGDWKFVFMWDGSLG